MSGILNKINIVNFVKVKTFDLIFYAFNFFGLNFQKVIRLLKTHLP